MRARKDVFDLATVAAAKVILALDLDGALGDGQRVAASA